MQTRINPSPQLLRLASLQAGVLSIEQAAGHGLGRHPVARLIDAGQWRRLDRGIVYVRDEDPPWLASAWAGVLLGGDQARIGGAGAGHLHGLLAKAPEVVPVLVRHETVLRSRPPWEFQRERAGVRSGRTVGGPPRLTMEDTVLDLCQEAGVERVVHLVTQAVQQRLTSVERLQRALASRQRVRHRRLIEHLLADVAEGAESPLEVTYLNDVERAHGLPRGERQRHSGGNPHIRDVLYRRYRTVVELDGRLGHEGMGRFRDMGRDNAAAVAGEASLRYGWGDVAGRSCEVAWQVDHVIRLGGWRGMLKRCRRCARVEVYG